MKPFLRLLLFNLSFPFLIFAQTEGWSSVCLAGMPTIAEVMIDACGDEFKSEYVVLRGGDAPFNIRQYALRVTNPVSNAFVGSVSVQDNSVNPAVIQQLNTLGLGTCGYAPTFRDVFSAPYFGIVPPHVPVLVFNNKDSTDISYLSPNALSRLCGSKVLVAFGTLRPQSPGQPIFRNFPPNNNCGATGCLRQVAVGFDNINYCQNLIYDIKKVAHPDVNNPSASFLGGGYIRPALDGTIDYGSDNVSNTSGCMSPQAMACVIPPLPDYGNGFWNVSLFDGFNAFSNPAFKGFYQTRDHDLGNGSFEFYTARQGWKPFGIPSEAHPTFGAMTAYNGCEVKADSFSFIAKRQGFPCGTYGLTLEKYDDFARIRIDANGDGTFEFDQSYNPPGCASGCSTEVWQGNLGFNSRIEIWSYDIKNQAYVHLIFNKKNQTPLPLNLSANTTPSVCGSATGVLNLSITGGTAPYSIQWAGASTIPANATVGNNLAAGLYSVTVSDAANCRDSARFRVAQTNSIVVNAGRDTVFCAGGTAQLRGSATGGTGTLTYEWLAPTGQVIANQATASVTPSVTTTYTLRVTDGAGCIGTASVTVRVNPLPLVEFETFINNRKASLACNDTNIVLKPRGAVSYCWSGFPRIIESAFSRPFPHCQSNNDSMIIFSLFLPRPDPFYVITLTGTDANGCVNTMVNPNIVIKPLPETQLLAFPKDTFCKSEAAFELRSISQATNIRYEAGLIDPITKNVRPCPNCIAGNMFYPQRAAAGEYIISAAAVDTFGCRNAPSRLLYVVDCNCATPAFADAGNDTTLCEQSSLQLRGVIRNVNRATWVTSGSGTFSNVNDVNAVYTFSNADIQRGRVTLALITDDPDGIQQACSSAEDSIIIVLLKRPQNVLNRTICQGDSFRFNNRWLNTAGIFYDTIRQAGGRCDSIVMLNLSIKRPAMVDAAPILTCIPSENGRVDTVRVGCDSIVFYRRIYQARPTTTLNRQLCAGDSLFFNGRWYNTTTRDSAIFRTSSGCDSMVFLNLSVGQAFEIVSTQRTCNSQKVGRVITGRIRSVNGCDSIVLVTETLLTGSNIRAVLNITNPIACFNKKIGAIEISSVTDGTAPYTYRWNTGDTTRTLRNLPSGLYIVTITDREGCQTVASQLLDEPLPLTLDFQALTPPCRKDLLGALQFNGINSPNAPYTIRINQNTRSFSTVPTRFDSLRVGNYLMTVTDSRGCSIDTNFVIAEAKDLVLDLGGPYRIALGDSFYFAPFVNFAVRKANWSGDKNIRCDSCLTTVVSPYNSTTYKLILKDNNGCTVSDEALVLVEKSNRIFAPNIFNPSSEEPQNRSFMPFADKSVERFKLFQVFNRWGNLLYTVKDIAPGDISKGWDGTYQGKALPPDVFVYSITIVFIDGTESVLSGDFFLKR